MLTAKCANTISKSFWVHSNFVPNLKNSMNFLELKYNIQFKAWEQKNPLKCSNFLFKINLGRLSNASMHSASIPFLYSSFGPTQFPHLSFAHWPEIDQLPLVFASLPVWPSTPALGAQIEYVYYYDKDLVLFKHIKINTVLYDKRYCYFYI